MSTASATEAQQALGTVVGQPDTIRAFFILLAYTAVLVAADTLGLPAQGRHRRKGRVTRLA